MTSRILLVLALLAVVTLGAVPAYSAVFSISAGANSSIAFDDSTAPNGVNNWTVAGVNQLFQQWFWYRLGSGPEAQIQTLDANPFVSTGVIDTKTSFASITYTSPGLMAVSVVYTLGGSLNPNSPASDLGELITIENLSGGDLDLHFFQYSDFDLNGSVGSQSLSFSGSPVNTVDQQSVPNGTEFSETVLTSKPNHYQGDYYPVILSSLEDGSSTLLDDTNHVTTPGDATWAFEWDVVIPVDTEFKISKDKTLNSPNFFGAPEPSSLAVWGLLGLSMSAGAWLRRRRSA